jgi:hypothetical protein
MAPERTQRITKLMSSSTTTWTWPAVDSWLGLPRRCAHESGGGVPTDGTLHGATAASLDRESG